MTSASPGRRRAPLAVPGSTTRPVIVPTITPEPASGDLGLRVAELEKRVKTLSAALAGFSLQLGELFAEVARLRSKMTREDDET